VLGPADFVSNTLTSKADYISALAKDKGQFLPDGIMPKSGPATVYNVEKLAGKITGTVNLKATYTNAFRDQGEQAGALQDHHEVASPLARSRRRGTTPPRALGLDLHSSPRPPPSRAAGGPHAVTETCRKSCPHYERFPRPPLWAVEVFLGPGRGLDRALRSDDPACRRRTLIPMSRDLRDSSPSGGYRSQGRFLQSVSRTAARV
jgi:hypothetical protein